MIILKQMILFTRGTIAVLQSTRGFYTCFRPMRLGDVIVHPISAYHTGSVR
jgi:hypothetical protein